MELRPLHPLIGAEVLGLDLRRPLGDAAFADLREAFEAFSVLVLRGQDISDDEQVSFSRRFGPLETTKVGSLGHGSNIVILTNIGPDGELMPETDREMLNTRANQLWHSDSSFKLIPALASILSGREVPPEGGETEFVSMRAVYRALPEAMRARIDPLVAIHDYSHSRGKIDTELATPEERAALPPVRQAVVREHPVTGAKALYLGSHACAIEGLPAREGGALIDELLEFATQPRFVCTHRWQPHDLLIWDNRAVIHRGRPFSARHRRYLVRTTVAGDAPTAGEVAR